MRILITTDAIGGVWQYSLDLAAGLSTLGAEPVLAVIGPAPCAAQKAEALSIPRLELVSTGMPLDWLASSAEEVRNTGRAVASLVHRLGADLVQVNAPAIAATHFDVPVVTVCHSCVATWWAAVRSGPLPRDFVWRARLTLEGLIASDRYVTPSAAFAHALVDTYALPSPPTVVHNGRTAPAALNAGEPRKGDSVFAAGRLWDDGKNVAVLDRAAAMLPVEVRVAGPLNGPNGASIELRNVRPLGNLNGPAMAEELANRPIFVSTALYEPFGLAVLEAAQAGCALVLSDIPTFRELWDGTAVFVDPDDERALATAIVELLRDKTRQEDLGASAAKRAAHYTASAMTAGMLDIYRAALAGNGLERRAVA